jgi:two-component system, OmpR family, sensor histidine kinase VicK
LAAPSSYPSSSDTITERTEVVHGEQDVVNAVLQLIVKTNNRIDACMDHTRPSLAIGIQSVRKAIIDSKNRGIRLRLVTEITKDNISYCKELMRIIYELRHLNGIKGSFYLSESEYLAPAVSHEKGKPAAQIIYSSVKEIVEHQQYVFDSFWSRAIPAQQKIREIEEGVEAEFYEVITDHKKAAQVLVDLAESITKEALIIVPNDKSMIRLNRLGVIDYTIKASEENGAEVKMISPLTEVNSEIVKKISRSAPNIKILNGSISPYGMYIVDGKKFFRAELKEAEAEDLSESIGFTLYSNSKQSVDSFKSVFNLLWNERILNEELKRAEKMQKEFINIAAHELRTPIQPILGLTQVLQHEIKDIHHKDLIDVIIRNARRLQKLTEDMLDITKIESQLLKLKIERFSINDLVSNIIQDYRCQREKDDNNTNVFEIYNQSKKDKIVSIQADKERITQVIFNLLSNAFKFTKKGNISIKIEVQQKGEGNQVIVSVKDTGEGISPEILPRLFTKFATKSEKGTGLGLYISKSIVEAHGGRIWAENNADGRGATFYFSLPLTNIQREEEKRTDSSEHKKWRKPETI